MMDEPSFQYDNFVCFDIMLLVVLSKASLGPYAWQSNRVKKLRLRHPGSEPNPEHLPVETRKHTGDQLVSQGVAWEDAYLRHPDLALLPRSRDVFRKIEGDPCLSLKLPPPRATAGGVLRHAICIFEKLLKDNKPMTFKFGISHDAHVRWHNPVWGYRYSKDPFAQMIVIFAASNPHAPAFLEAALIEKFGSSLYALS